MKITSEVRKLFYVYSYENLERVCVLKSMIIHLFIKQVFHSLAIHAPLCYYGRSDIVCSHEDVFINEFALFL